MKTLKDILLAIILAVLLLSWLSGCYVIYEYLANHWTKPSTYSQGVTAGMEQAKQQVRQEVVQAYNTKQVILLDQTHGFVPDYMCSSTKK